jgi:pimeloyl-ACP methyl ester carboxylesterase
VKTELEDIRRRNHERFEARLAIDQQPRSNGADVRGTARLAVDATLGVMDVVAEMQKALTPPIISHIAALSSASVRGTTTVVGVALDAVLGALAPVLGESASTAERELVLAAVNGVVGDHLERTGSPLAMPMTLRPPLVEDSAGTLVLLAHGSSMSWRGFRAVDSAGVPHDHGRGLLDELDGDVTLAYLDYNSGRHVAENGVDLTELLEREHERFEEILLIGFSMGGLVCRSAFAVAAEHGHRWPDRVKLLATIATPHHGSHIERAGNFFETVVGAIPWTAPLAALARIRSAGVTDLRYGAVVDVDPDRFARGEDRRTPTPLPQRVYAAAIAGTRTASGDAENLDDATGFSDDIMVPVASALGMHDDETRTLAFDERHVVLGTNHIGTLASKEVFQHLAAACRAARRGDSAETAGDV